MEAGTNEWIKIVRSKDALSKSGCWTRVCGFWTGSRSPFVSSVQNGRGTIYRPAALGSCLPKTHSLADVQADWPKARIRFPLPWSETRFRPSEDPNVHTADTNSRANCSRRTHSERLLERDKSRMGKGSTVFASLGEFLAITQQHNTASILNLSIPRLSKSDLWIGDCCTWYLGRWAEGATDLAGRPYVRNSHIALTKTVLDYVLVHECPFDSINTTFRLPNPLIGGNNTPFEYRSQA